LTRKISFNSLLEMQTGRSALLQSANQRRFQFSIGDAAALSAQQCGGVSLSAFNSLLEMHIDRSKRVDAEVAVLSILYWRCPTIMQKSGGRPAGQPFNSLLEMLVGGWPHVIARQRHDLSILYWRCAAS